jgi:hypothetical protein
MPARRDAASGAGKKAKLLNDITKGLDRQFSLA